MCFHRSCPTRRRCRWAPDLCSAGTNFCVGTQTRPSPDARTTFSGAQGAQIHPRALDLRHEPLRWPLAPGIRAARRIWSRRRTPTSACLADASASVKLGRPARPSESSEHIALNHARRAAAGRERPPVAAVLAPSKDAARVGSARMHPLGTSRHAPVHESKARFDPGELEKCGRGLPQGRARARTCPGILLQGRCRCSVCGALCENGTLAARGCASARGMRTCSPGFRHATGGPGH